ncbi:hypothetical protein Poli38472_009469 [Pythium oligandrum]|uniref:Uncharacterized protein n=1 Tax=Pythium oligandrum TaxID=41045 RepID=A0A8K1CFN4_PYTOL|nr:hypothetical protein Poli38472_009469 [Pythium oligandrum]|eukprot:TMW61976.1 hypothetical protein Poli38472_009469 [Pythium oligandrum]
MGLATAETTNMTSVTTVETTVTSVEVTETVSVSVASAEVKGKRAKKTKKVSKEEEEAANIAATIDHPYLSFLHKRIRLYKKKLEKIKALEVAQATEGKVLNDQQLELVGSRALVEKMIVEFEALREQFIGVYAEEEKAKRLETSKEEVPVAKPHKEEEVKPSVVEVTSETSAFGHVEELLKTLHAVTLHQALGKEIPMVLDYFSKVLLGKTRLPVEVAFEENLAESLEEAKRYLEPSDKVVACDMSYRDLRAIVDQLAAPLSSVQVEDVSEAEAVAIVDAVMEVQGSPSADALPEINFFTDSQLEPEVVVVVDASPAPESEDVAVENPVSEGGAVAPVEGEAKATKKAWNRNPRSGSPASEQSDDKNRQRRRSQGRWKKNGSPKNNGESKSGGESVKNAESGKSNNNKPRRPRPQGSDEIGGAQNVNRGATNKDDRRPPRSDRPVRKQASAPKEPKQ